MNICFATSSFPAGPDDWAHGGFLLEAIDCLSRAGHQISVLTQARTASPRPPLRGLDVVWFPWRQIEGRLAELSFSSPAAMRSAVSLVYNGARGVAEIRKKHHIDVFIGAWMIPSGLYLYLDRILGGGTPYVLWALGSDVNKYKANPFVRQILRRVARGAGQLYADGYELCDSVRQMTGRGCDFLPTFRPIQVAPAAPPRSRGGPVRFLYVGRHVAVKGPDVLVDALVQMKQQGSPESPDYLFDIVGDGEMTPALQAKIESAGLSAQVRFPGRIDDSGLYALYAACDCVVIPSRSESIPVVLSEALQAGRPLIVTDVGDMGRVVREHQLGEVVPREDPRALASAIRRFIEAPKPPNESGRTRLISDLMFESAAPKLLRRLEEITARA